MQYAIGYLLAFAVFALMDFVWLGAVGAKLYRAALGDLLAPRVRLAPAAVFYLLYPVGIVAFGALQGLRINSALAALGWGAAFGALAYATYDLTNFATLRLWSLQITLVDIVYGALASGIAAVAAFYVMRALSG
jgi:uncharacterized membrane protein